MCLGSFAIVLDFAVLSIGVGDIIRDLRVPLATVQLALVTYSVLAAALAMAGGKLSSLLSPLRIQLLGLNLYAVGMLITAAAINGPVLVAGQMVAGVGAALLVPNGLAILGAAYSGRRRSAAVALQSGTIGFGATLGLLLGGLLISALGWRAPFVLLGLLAVAALLCGSLIRLPLPQESDSIDAASVLLPCLGVVLIIGAVNQMGVWGFIAARHDAPFTFLGLSPAPPMLVAGVLVLQLFVGRQQAIRQGVLQPNRPGTGAVRVRLRAPLLEPSVLASGERKALLVCLVAVNLLFGGISFLLLLYAQTVLGYAVVDAAVLLLPLALATFIAAAAAGAVPRIVPPRALLACVYLLGSGGTVLLAYAVAADWGGPALAAGQVATGAAIGLGLSLGGAFLTVTAEPELAGEIGSVRGLASFLGTALGTALGGTVLLAGLDNIGNLVARQGFTLPPDVALDPAAATSVVPNYALHAFFSGSAWNLTPAQVSSAVEISMQARLDALQAGLVVLALASLAGVATARLLPRRAAVPGAVR
ncbi:MFS transporter [Arthrobacter sp. GCM10027362]|uniref:MFS transporter n=1 Tax=Arthrobacter sp. GCM10027362 TaxID=3273379 RepID=UPI003629F54B